MKVKETGLIQEFTAFGGIKKKWGKSHDFPHPDN